MDELTREQIGKARLQLTWHGPYNPNETNKWVDSLCDMALAYLSAKEGREGAMVLAWDDGYWAGQRDKENEGVAPETPNPFRASLAERKAE